MAFVEETARKELGGLFQDAVLDHPDVMAECRRIPAAFSHAHC